MSKRCLLCESKTGQRAVFIKPDFRLKYRLPEVVAYRLCHACACLPADLRNAEVESGIVRAFGGEMTADDMHRSAEGTRKHGVC